MKFLYTLLIAFLFLQITTVAQEGWLQQSSGTNFNLRSVYFLNENVGWIVGDDWNTKSGVILHTTNGGTIWETQVIDSIRLGDVQFINENMGWITGGNFATSFNSYVVFKTTDGGMNWDTTQISNNIGSPGKIFFINDSIGWVTKPGTTSFIFKTTNGGENWFEIPNPASGGIISILFVDDSTGWLSTAQTLHGGGGMIYKTTNGGESWVLQFHMTQGSGGRPGRLSLSLYFLTNDIGWAVGGGGWYDTLTSNTGLYRIIFKTTNGGSDWNIQLHDSIPGNGTNYDYLLLDVQFTDSSNGWAVGEGGNILHTTDGGLNWIEQESGTTETLKSIFFINENHGWIVGENGTILHTINGGVSFIEEREFDEIPTDYNLSHNYPNPFNPSTIIKYSIQQSSNVVIIVFDVLGNEIETLINEEKPSGTYELAWNAANLPSGVYFYQLRAGNFIETKKMLLLK